MILVTLASVEVPDVSLVPRWCLLYSCPKITQVHISHYLAFCSGVFWNSPYFTLLLENHR